MSAQVSAQVSSHASSQDSQSIIRNVNDLYIDQIIQMKESVFPYDLPQESTVNFADAIQKYLTKKINTRLTGRCVDVGYVKPNSIDIVSRSIGKINASHFNGEVYYNIQARCKVCKPSQGQIVEGSVVGKSKHCVMVVFGPLQIAIPTTHHADASFYASLEKGDKVHVRLISYKFKLNDDSIKVIGQYVKKV
jgi:DNA-directed RNA polymerase subunit E'/Rpb7